MAKASGISIRPWPSASPVPAQRPARTPSLIASAVSGPGDSAPERLMSMKVA
ncbi:MAG: hypothetical protein BWY52_01564 [Chloroflexi bacterium ADurb.Bin325]|nr:MAG: hypothetical protein BWY52_01564 [Chloroflexi bacterium ADurb.Bin325]